MCRVLCREQNKVLLVCKYGAGIRIRGVGMGNEQYWTCLCTVLILRYSIRSSV